MKKHKCKCPHINVKLSGDIGVDGNKKYFMLCLDCKKELDVIYWLVDKVKRLTDDCNKSDK